MSNPRVDAAKFKELTGEKLRFSPDGVPVLETQASCLCRVTRVFAAGDHLVVVAALEDVHAGAEKFHQTPLLYKNQEFVEFRGSVDT